MTRHQRARVVEFLRCAADRLLMGGSMAAPLTDAVFEIHGDSYAGEFLVMDDEQFRETYEPANPSSGPLIP